MCYLLCSARIYCIRLDQSAMKMVFKESIDVIKTPSYTGVKEIFQESEMVTKTPGTNDIVYNHCKFYIIPKKFK